MIRTASRNSMRMFVIVIVALCATLTVGAPAAVASAPPIVPSQWQGGAGAPWTTPGNWSTNAVPDVNTDVQIPDSASISAVPTVAVHGLTIGNGVTLASGASVDLTVQGGEVRAGTGGTFTNVGLTLWGATVGADSTFASNTTFKGAIHAYSDVTVTGPATINSGTSIEFGTQNEPTFSLQAGATGALYVSQFGDLELAGGTFGQVTTYTGVSTSIADVANVTITGQSTFGDSVSFNAAHSANLSASGNQFAAGVFVNDAGAAVTVGDTATFRRIDVEGGSLTAGAGASVMGTDRTSVHGGTLTFALPITNYNPQLLIDGGSFVTTGTGSATFGKVDVKTTGNASFAGASTFAGDLSVASSAGAVSFGTNAMGSGATITGDAQIDRDLTAGQITFAAGSDSTVTETVGGYGMAAAAVTVDAGAKLALTGATITGFSGAVLTNNGVVTSTGAVSVGGALGAGTIDNGPTGVLTVDPGAAGALTLSGTGISTFTNNGDLIQKSGSIIATSFIQGPGGRLRPTLLTAGTTAGTNYTQLDVSNANLQGALLTDVAPGYPAPAVGTSFDVISYDSLDPTNRAFFQTSASGFFEGGLYLTVDAPTAAPGAVKVSTRKATAALASATVVPGGTLTVTGSGFLPGEDVVFGLGVSTGENGGPVKEVILKADGQGAISGSLVVPATATISAANNTYSVITSGTVSGAFLSFPVTVTAPPMTTPKDSDGDSLLDAVDCAPTDKTKPAQGKGVVDADCNGVNDAIQPFTFTGVGTKNDKVTTRDGNDTIKSGKGNDTIKSNGGNDKIDAGPGNDKVDAGAGNDTAAGGTGNDSITGGPGKDKLSGGTGNDKINAKDKNNGDTVVCGAGKDTVSADKKDKVAKDCEKVIRS